MHQAASAMAIEESLPALLDQVDVQTAHQERLHDHLSDGFLSLARAWYHGAPYRKFYTIYRSMRTYKRAHAFFFFLTYRTEDLSALCSEHANISVDNELNIVKQIANKQCTPLPNSDFRNAAQAFRNALEEAVQAAAARRKCEVLIAEALKDCKQE